MELGRREQGGPKNALFLGYAEQAAHLSHGRIPERLVWGRSALPPTVVYSSLFFSLPLFTLYRPFATLIRSR